MKACKLYSACKSHLVAWSCDCAACTSASRYASSAATTRTLKLFPKQANACCFVTCAGNEKLAGKLCSAATSKGEKKQSPSFFMRAATLWPATAMSALAPSVVFEPGVA